METRRMATTTLDLTDYPADVLWESARRTAWLVDACLIADRREDHAAAQEAHDEIVRELRGRGLRVVEAPR
jgi:hypothetical protein